MSKVAPVQRAQKITLGEMRETGARPGSSSIAAITNVRIPSLSPPIAGPIASGFRTLNRCFSARPAVIAAPMSGRCLSKRTWARPTEGYLGCALLVNAIGRRTARKGVPYH